MYTARSSPIFINAYTVVRPTRSALAASSGVSSNWSLVNASEEPMGVSLNVPALFTRWLTPRTWVAEGVAVPSSEEGTDPVRLLT